MGPRSPILLLAAILAAASCAALPASAESVRPEAVGGVLELTGKDFLETSLLNGEWLFTPDDGSAPLFLEVPGSWNGVLGSAYSSGEYELLIKTPRSPGKTGEIGALLIPELSQAVEIRVNGELIGASGGLASGRTGFTRFLLPVSMSPEIRLTLKMRNSVFREGGLVYAPRFGSFERVRRIRESKIWFESAVMGFFLLVAIYHLFLFSRGYRNISALYLGIAAAMMLIRGITTGENIIFVLFPGFSWSADYRIEYISAYFTATAILRFFDALFPHPRRGVRTAIAVESWAIRGLSLMTAVVPIAFLSKTIYLLVGTILVSFVLGFAILVNAQKERKPASGLFFWGGLVSIALFVVDSLTYLGGPARIVELSQIGMVLFVLVQTLVLSRIYGDAHLRAEKLTRSLEEEVAERTADLKATNLSLQEEIARRKKIQDRLTVLSTTDPLTGAANRNKMNAFLDQNHRVFLRYGYGYGLIMLDIDHFKNVNDAYGHEAGDAVLKEVVSVTTSVIRNCDILARWGGEEFLILLPTLDLKGTERAAERIRSTLEETLFPEADRVTASFGATSPRPEETMKDILARVDENLYAAKQEGRNRVVSL